MRHLLLFFFQTNSSEPGVHLTGPARPPGGLPSGNATAAGLALTGPAEGAGPWVRWPLERQCLPLG